MIYQIWHSGESTNRDSIHVEWAMPQNYHIDHDYSYRKVVTGRPLPKDIRLPLLTQAKKAKLVDFISAAGIDSVFMILSENVIDIFSKIKMPKHVLVNADIDGEAYHGLHFDEIITSKFIHWENSEFYIRTGLEHDTSILYNFSDYDEYRMKRKELTISSKGRSSFNSKSIQLNEVEYDLFYSFSPVHGIFCSQKFVNMVKKNNLVGFRFEPIKDRYPTKFDY